MYRFICAIICAVALSACSSVSLENAKRLSQAGVDTSRAVMDGGIATRTSFRNSRDVSIALCIMSRASARFGGDGEFIHDTDKIAETCGGSEQARTDAIRVDASLADRVALFKELNALYVTFKDLTDLNAAAAFNEQFLLLKGDIEKSAAALAPTPGSAVSIAVDALGDTAGVAIGTALGFAETEFQKRAIAQANDQMILALDAVIKLYEEDIDEYQSIQQVADEISGDLLKQLARKNLVELTDYAEELLALTGAELSKDALTVLGSEERLRAMLIEVASVREANNLTKEVDVHTAMLTALRTLKIKHLEFKETKKVSRLEELEQIAKDVTEIYKQLEDQMG